MKIKIFRNLYLNELEEDVNEFIQDKEIIDIKFQKDNVFYILIMYK
jgi:hypothetical protein